MPRGPKLSQELRDFVRSRYVYAGLSSQAIADEINNDRTLRSKFGKMDMHSIYYHVQKVKADLDRYIDGDTLERVRMEFVRIQEAYDQEIADLTDMIKNCNDQERKLRLMRFKHEVMGDKVKVLASAELPIKMKQLEKQKDFNIKAREIKPEDYDPSVISKDAHKNV